MNAKMTSVALAIIATSAAAFAAEPDQAGKTRAEVRAELAQTPAAASTEYVEAPRLVSGKSRAEVRAELQQAYANGELRRNTEYVEFTHVATSKSRDEVRDEAIRAAKAGREQVDYSGR